MLRKLILGLLILLAIVALQWLLHAQDCGVNPQNHLIQEEPAAGFDNPSESDSLIGIVVVGYAVGIFIMLIRALLHHCSPRPAHGRVLNL
jgi:hypothetical protein